MLSGRLLGALAVSTLVAAASICAQEPNDPRIELGRTEIDKTSKGSIRGRVVMPGGRFVDQNLKVTLMTVNGPQAWTYTEYQGRFEFLGLNPGNYEVQVETNEVHPQTVTQVVQVFRGAPSVVSIALTEKADTTKRNATPVVSVNELGAAIPKAAQKEFKLASKAEQENNAEEAIAHLRKAIAIFPAFVQARSDLGAQLFSQGKLDEAEQQLRDAIDIDPSAFNPRLNLGIVLVQQQEFIEAVANLDRAVSLNPDSPAARLYLGLAYMGTVKLDAAEAQLKAAYTMGGNPYSIALFHLGQLYMTKGDRESALKSFQEYLRVMPDAPNSSQVLELIALLR